MIRQTPLLKFIADGEKCGSDFSAFTVVMGYIVSERSC